MPITGMDYQAALKGGVAFNVKEEFGALGTEAVDDAPAINRAIEALPATGGSLYFPAGIYKCQTGLEITKPAVRFYGDGWDQETVTNGSIIKAGAVMASLVKSSSAAATFSMDHIALNGSGNAETVLKTEGINTQIYNMFVRQPKTAGVAIEAAGTSPWMNSVRVNNANQAETTAIKIAGTDAIIIGCKPVNCRYGFELTAGASGCQILGGHATPGNTIGKNIVFVNGNASRVSIQNLRIDNHLAGAAIQISPSANVETYQITGCIGFQNGIENELWPFIGLDTTASNIKGLSVTGNSVGSASSHLYSAMIAGIKANGEAATNKGRVKTAGTVCSGNTIWAKAFYGSEVEVLNTAGQNSFTADNTTWEAK